MASANNGTGKDTAPEDFSSAISVDTVETAKLDARVYSADDFDGQAEGAASSGSLSHAMLQAALVTEQPDGGDGQFVENADMSEDGDEIAAQERPQPTSDRDAQPMTAMRAAEADSASGSRAEYTMTTVIEAPEPRAEAAPFAEGASSAANNSTSSGGGDRTITIEGADGASTIIFNETTNNFNTFNYNITNIDNSSVGDTIVIGGNQTVITNIVEGPTTNNYNDVSIDEVNIVGDTIVGDTLIQLGDDITTIINNIGGGAGGGGGGGGGGGPITIDIGDITTEPGGIVDLGDVITSIGPVVVEVVSTEQIIDLAGVIVSPVVGSLVDIDIGDVAGDVIAIGDIAGDVTNNVDNIVDIGDVATDVGQLLGDITINLGDVTTDIGDLVGDITLDLGSVVGDTTTDIGNIVNVGDLVDVITGDFGDLVGDTTVGIGNLLGDVTVGVGDIVETGDVSLDLIGDVTVNLVDVVDAGLVGISGITATVADILDGETGGLPDLGGDTDPDLVVNAGVGVGATSTALPTIEVPLDPVEEILGDIDIDLAAEAGLLTPDDALLDVVLDAPAVPLVESAEAELAIESPEPAENLIGDAGDLAADAGEAASAAIDALAGGDGGDTDLVEDIVSAAVDPAALAPAIADAAESLGTELGLPEAGGGPGGDSDLVIDGAIAAAGTETPPIGIALPLDPLETAAGDIDLHVDAAVELLAQADPGNAGTLGSDLGLAADAPSMPGLDETSAEFSLGDLFARDPGTDPAGAMSIADAGADVLPQPSGDVTGGLSSVIDHLPAETHHGLGLF